MIHFERLNILNPAGGLRYHWRAHQYRSTLWAEYIQELYDWLSQWQPTQKKLILIGPSAGHCLKPEFVSRFDHLIGVEIDPVARWLFTRRFGVAHKTLEWRTQNLLLSPGGDLEIKGLKKLFDENPDSAVLFCNFLGQVPTLFPDAVERESFTRFRSDLRHTLKNRAWASFHDRLSGAVKPQIDSSDKPLTNNQLADRFYQDPGTIELMDHQTDDFFREPKVRYFSWELMPGIFHLIEGVSRC